MDIFNRPPSIAEDTLHYTIYPPSDAPEKASATTYAACISSYVESLIPDFVWHRDAFEVKLAPNLDSDGSWILEGRMRVGDCVDDEWCTVWLLKQISSKWDLAISVYDSDGEFLLIEAAEELPSWVKPTNSENRVWIYQSRLHLIPLTHASSSSRQRRRRKLPGAADSDDEDTGAGDDDAFLAAEDAVKVVRDSFIETFAPAEVEKIVWRRIAGYPSAMKNHVHTTKAYIPEDVLKALSENASLVQKAVETFYTRDAIQLRAAHRMTRFPPNTSILASVKMTRTAYAQLVGQKFFPPKIFGQWKESEGSKEWRWKDVGMKIAVGFEMLYQESKGRHNAQNFSAEGIAASAEANKEALQRDSDYQKYISNLVTANYFRGEVKGSELWKSLELKAAATFVEVRRSDDASRQPFASQVDAAVLNAAAQPMALDRGEDSEDWLTVDTQDFDQMLEATMGGRNKGAPTHVLSGMDVDHTDYVESAEDRLASEQARKLKDLASKVESFVDGEGDLEGARFEDEEFSDESFSDDEDTSNSEESDSVPQESRNAKRQAALDKLVPALEPSDYGKMPATFHANSQRVTPATVASDAVEASPRLTPTDQHNPKVEPKSPPKPPRPPIIPRDKYDGVDSDDETDEEDVEDAESEEDRPQVVGDIEIDMGEEEEEFLEFSRQALGISDAQWSEIVKDRQDRGAFLPPSAAKPLPQKPTAKSEVKPDKKPHIPRVPEPGPRPNVNPELDSFEAVMKALDEALSQKQSEKKKSSKPTPKPAPRPTEAKGKGKQKATVEDAMNIEDDDEEDIDIDAAMEAELKEALLQGGEDSDGEEPPDYNMIKNFLESFKSQAGLSGPVSNLAGRLAPDLKFPRDDAF